MYQVQYFIAPEIGQSDAGIVLRDAENGFASFSHGFQG